MEATFWNTRYTKNDTVYGYEPNQFFKSFIDSHKPGSILLPAEGEGRNAIYAASKGWEVTAFDFSEVAKEKALRLAQSKKVHINYDVLNIQNFKAGKLYDAVGLIYVHLPDALRKQFHQAIYQSLKPAGYLVLEAFSKAQIEYDSGGPKDVALLYDAPALCNDFQFLHLLCCQQKEIVLNEGAFHKGKAAVLQIIGQKL
jgi:SAM-dependent methyltransferase